MSVFDTFEKKHEYLVCVNSDGCAMDTMNCKHIHCFGPCMVDEWGLNQWRAPILKRWNDVNLFQMTRGANRFRSLAQVLGEVRDHGIAIPGLDTLKAWAAEAPVLSNAALAAAMEACEEPEGKACLEKALHWSTAVNAAIEALPAELRQPIPGAQEGLEAVHRFADVAVVSSANRDVVEGEWSRAGLLEHTDLVLAQDCGSKQFCIQQMLKFGYAPDHVLMVGDAVDDCQAAEENGIWFFPILVNREKESWTEWREFALDKFRDGSYGGLYQDTRKKELLENLGG